MTNRLVFEVLPLKYVYSFYIVMNEDFPFQLISALEVRIRMRLGSGISSCCVLVSLRDASGRARARLLLF